MNLSPEAKKEETREERKVYSPPAIIYESVISTRAGSPLNEPDLGQGVDPADFFGS